MSKEQALRLIDAVIIQYEEQEEISVSLFYTRAAVERYNG